MKTITYLILPCMCIGSPVLKAQTTFNYTGAVQTYTVPACVISLTVDLRAAEGAGGPPTTDAPVNLGGKGGRVQATIDVIPGEILNIYVGQKPTSNAGGWNGGGNGGTGSTSGGGGGASDIRRGGTDFSNRIIIAGGGGGASYTCVAGGDAGGDGGGLTAKHGWDCNTYGGPGAGKGGSQSEGGAAATGCGTGGSTAGDFGIGGNGGGSSTQPGGGGGAGYYGGGGGNCRGGGGGSSYIDSIATGVTNTIGFQVGNGQVIITPGAQGAPAPKAIIGPDSACTGSIASYSVDAVSGATSYDWLFPAGSAINSGQGTNAVEVTIGNTSGDISVTVTTTCGTSAARTMPLTTLDCGGTGIEKISEQVEMSVFPNPAGDVLYIQIGKMEEKQFTITLLNILGQVVYSDKVVDEPFKTIDVSSFPKGLYYLRVLSSAFNQVGNQEPVCIY